jgi:hypothetical protein
MRLEEGKQRQVLQFALTQASNAVKSASVESAPPHFLYCFPHAFSRDTQTKVHTPHFGFSRLETELNRKKEDARMLIRIEKARTPQDWNVWMNAWCVKFRSYAEALAFVSRLEGRINAPHLLPVSEDRLVLER